LKVYTIWSEGYAATGQHATAFEHGQTWASSFDEAVRKLVPGAYQVGERWYTWGCEVFDNEADARKGFG
jgi:hypothetical protein